MRRPLLAILLAAVLILSPTASTGGTPQGSVPAAAQLAAREPWRWPAPPPMQIVEPYVAPPHRYGPGHRGVDVAAEVGAEVVAPADGTVAFVGTVVDRPLITIDHGDGLVSTLEPVSSDLTAGDRVLRGQAVGRVATGGHTAHGALHIGARLHGEYVNPLLLLGNVPRAVLLPCC
ncbi:murein hydrolase activator EnvC family protein [Microbacterium album]|uniref:M23ase beta-sheet core domain-containing protein n=1 Tax=Microbacterium album TaxID=2053191 RepID=A0A917IDT9_9MICO|nr:M23 family metallopeptidase [Microbacterium album]GGH39396.1 hypothetical protein GCM10010921_10570 [Microbacterium album]